METRLVKKAVKGNKKAFDQLIRQVSHEGYRLAYYYLKHEADSQDALGSAIEKAFKKIKELEEAEKFKSWFMSIVVNESRMLLRTRKASKVVPIEGMIEIKDKEADLEGMIDLRGALDLLHEDDRTILKLKYYEGYTFREIAHILDMAESTVKTRTYKLLGDLRQELKRKAVYHVK